MCEIDYLNREISDAQAALSQTAANILTGCAASVDARKWIKKYPWVAMGVATVAGFTAATIVTPAPGTPVGEKWSHLRSKFCSDSTGNSVHAARYPHTRRGGVAGTILGSLFDLTKLLLETLIIAALRNATASQKEAAAQTTGGVPLDVSNRPPSGLVS
jgi:hypothetical protein